MNLKEYLIECIIEDKDIITSLLYIDNQIQYTNLSYDELLDKIRNTEICLDIDTSLFYSAITDGEIESVIKVLISIPKLKSIYVNRTSVGINKYLIDRTNRYYKDQNIELNIDNDYNSYKDHDTSIIVCAFNEMVEDIKDKFKGIKLVIIK